MTIKSGHWDGDIRSALTHALGTQPRQAVRGTAVPLRRGLELHRYPAILRLWLRGRSSRIDLRAGGQSDKGSGLNAGRARSGDAFKACESRRDRIS